jgi:hypothetical protein
LTLRSARCRLPAVMATYSLEYGVSLYANKPITSPSPMLHIQARGWFHQSAYWGRR